MIHTLKQLEDKVRNIFIVTTINRFGYLDKIIATVNRNKEEVFLAMYAVDHEYLLSLIMQL